MITNSAPQRELVEILCYYKTHPLPKIYSYSKKTHLSKALFSLGVVNLSVFYTFL